VEQGGVECGTLLVYVAAKLLAQERGHVRHLRRVSGLTSFSSYEREGGRP
jgi:hypothetical protein